MAQIQFNCPICDALLETDDSLSGGVAECPQCQASVMIPMPGIAPGMEIAGYITERKLGSGGMGEVWLATQKTMDRKVALKILPPAMSTNAAFISRFIAEVKNSAKLLHPNIVTAFDAGVDKGTYYMAISYVDGTVLDDLLEEGKALPEHQALTIGRQMADALLYAWEDFRILHRDIKPANIMLDQKGKAKLMDMGVSKSLSENRSLTMAGLVVGTPYYMSPEQARADTPVDYRTDIYALGATLYHAITGTVPFESTSIMGILTKHITESFPPPIERNPSVSEPCAVLLEIMMAKSPDDRQQSWNAVIQDIDLVLAGRFPVTKRPEAGKSQVMKDLKNPSAEPQNAQRNIPKAKLGSTIAPRKHPVEQQDDPAATNSSPLLKRLLVTAVLLALAGAIIFGGMEYLKQKKAFSEKKRQEDLAKVELARKTQETAARLAEEKAKLEREKVEFERRQTEKAERETTIKELYEVAADFARKDTQNSAEIELALANFTKIRPKLKDTKYELLADAEMARLNTLLKKLAEERTTADSEKERLENERIQLEAERKLAEEKANSEKRKKETEAERRHNLLNAVAANLLGGNGKVALDKIEAFPDKKTFADLKDTVTEVVNADDFVLNSFMYEIGTDVTVELVGGRKETLRVNSIEGQEIVCEKGKGKTGKKLSIKELSNEERYRRLSKLDKTSLAILLALEDVKNKKYDDAKTHAADAGPLAKTLCEQINILKLGKAEGEAKNDFERILRLADVRSAAGAASAKLSEERAKELHKTIVDFKTKHGATRVAKDNVTALATLSDLVDSKLRASANAPTTPQ